MEAQNPLCRVPVGKFFLIPDADVTRESTYIISTEVGFAFHASGRLAYASDGQYLATGHNPDSTEGHHDHVSIFAPEVGASYIHKTEHPNNLDLWYAMYDHPLNTGRLTKTLSKPEVYELRAGSGMDQLALKDTSEKRSRPVQQCEYRKA